MKAKINNLHTKFFVKNKPAELTYHKAGLLMQYSRKYQPKKCDEVSGSKDGKRKFHDVWKSKFLWLIYDSSNNVNYVIWCLQKGRPRYCWQNRICYCNKSLNVKFWFFLIKVWNMKNVSIWFQQKPIPLLLLPNTGLDFKDRVGNVPELCALCTWTI